MDFKVISIADCTSKAGKPFYRLTLQTQDGKSGTYTVFNPDYKVGDSVRFTPTLAYSYGQFQWIVLLEKVGK